MLPLLIHRSEQPAFGGFSRPYLVLLLLLVATAVVVVLLVGRACRRAQGPAPAYAFVLAVAAVVGACLVTEVALTYHLRKKKIGV